jgi:CIC family chloride channel protein
LPTSPQPNVLSAGAPFGFSPWFWLLVVGTGIGAGVGGGLLMALLRAVQHLSWSYSAGTFLDAVEQVGWQQRIVVVVAAGILVGAVRWLWKQPPGGHAGELAEAIWFRCGRLPLAPALGRAVLSIVIVGMGASLGREAAPKQTGAAIANALAERARLSALERRLLVACGTGAGMAAVYNVPFGGALFALEVLLGSLALPLIAPALATSLIATWVSWLFLPNVAEYSVPGYDVSTPQIVWAIVFGPLAGLAAVAYIRAIAWADSHRPQGWPLFAAPLLVFAALGLLALVFPQLLGNGKDVVQQLLLDQLALPLLLPLLVLKPLVTSACLGSGAPGGLFTPTLTCGALLGGLCGRLWDFVWPGASAGSHALIGAAALLAAAMQGPVSAIVLVLELTRSADGAARATDARRRRRGRGGVPPGSALDLLGPHSQRPRSGARQGGAARHVVRPLRFQGLRGRVGGGESRRGLKPALRRRRSGRPALCPRRRRSTPGRDRWSVRDRCHPIRAARDHDRRRSRAARRVPARVDE